MQLVFLVLFSTSGLINIWLRLKKKPVIMRYLASPKGSLNCCLYVSVV